MNLVGVLSKILLGRQVSSRLSDDNVVIYSSSTIATGHGGHGARGGDVGSNNLVFNGNGNHVGQFFDNSPSFREIFSLLYLNPTKQPAETSTSITPLAKV